MAFCQFCGSQIPDDSKFCPNCGATLNGAQATVFQQNVNVDYSSSQNLPMNWYKFLIYFALFLGALSNCVTGFQALTGAHYGGSASMVYAYFSSLKVIDMAMGIACIALAVFAIFVRQKLAGFKSDGPKMLTLLYIASITVSLGYFLLCMLVIGGGFVNLTSILPSLVVSVIMIVVNKTYFDKRKHLFVN